MIRIQKDLFDVTNETRIYRILDASSRYMYVPFSDELVNVMSFFSKYAYNALNGHLKRVQ